MTTHAMTQVRVRYSMVQPQQIEPLYTPRVAAALAGISQQALDQYRRRGLVQPQRKPGSGEGYRAADIRRLISIRRLRQEVDLDLGAIEVVLHLRDQVLELQREMEDRRQDAARREEELLETIHELRDRLAKENS
jgi:MerR family transcriptional regulator, heat shock protein HspR